MKNKKSPTVQLIANNNYLLNANSYENSALVTMTNFDESAFIESPNYYGWVASTIDGVQIKFQPWGLQNNMPQAREALITNNNVVGTLLKTKRNVQIGLGLMAVKEQFINGTRKLIEVETPPPAKDFFDAINIDVFLRAAFTELNIHGVFFPEAIRGRGGKIVNADVKKTRHIRSGLKDVNGNIAQYFWCGDWLRKNWKQFPVFEIDFFDANLIQPKFVFPCSESLLDDNYYPTPEWQGSRDWIELSNLIPKFHLYNLQNGFTPRWHITIPQDYFKDTSTRSLTEKETKDNITKEDAARQDFIDTLNGYLTGLPGVGRGLITDEYFEPLAKQFVGIKILPLQVDLQGEAMLKLYEKSNQAVIASQGVHPTLAAIETGSTRAGGSEILRALQLYLITHTKQPRSAVIQFFNLVHKINGWDPSIKWAFRDETLTPLSEQPNGMVETAPTQ